MSERDFEFFYDDDFFDAIPMIDPTEHNLEGLPVDKMLKQELKGYFADMDKLTTKQVIDKSRGKMAVAIDTEYYFSVYFHSSKQKKEFLQKMGWLPLGGEHFISGAELAKMYRVPITDDIQIKVPKFVKGVKSNVDDTSAKVNQKKLKGRSNGKKEKVQ